ncbi:hypothetical protein Pan44_14890 [Caulifigura coniformis]|uniref:Peptidase C39-like domain-containing protein n=1 Tax=Caulifigura coniformis TaxID=2527983 RepID=A0A517SBI5_9PLAN|nr:hypothetical protein [Caulifigura coniformis]QDT53472.1 hypothetical protein Pan44_14890 [Caulifigura coniformis]
MIAILLPLLFQQPLPASHTERVGGTPDLCQTDKAGDFADGGRQFCGPVAVSDQFVWLANHGYPKLFPTATKGKAGQIELVNALAARNYMDTAGLRGTMPPRLMEALRGYVNDRGYELARIEYRGYLPSKGSFESSGAHFDRDWVRAAVANPRACAWLNIQWSKFDEAAGAYADLDRHWLCVVGYGEDARKNPAPDLFLVHDPAGRSGLQKKTDFVTLELLERGRFPVRGKEYDARGYYEIRDGLTFKEGADRALVIGGVVLELKPAL